jgi:hypothetical protein
MWPLQFYVNQKLDIVPEVDSVESYTKDCDTEEKLPVRNAVYEHTDLIDSFVAENPANLSDAELEIVSNWNNFVAGDFYVERFLKKGTIFIDSAESPQVYLVLGLTESLEEILEPYYRPPILVKTVLLPFKGRIIYDGLFQTYSVYFGGGIRGNLREIYMAAKQNRRIIDTLDPAKQARQQQKAAEKPTRDWGPEVDELVKAANKLKGQNVPIQHEAFSLLKAGALMAQAAVHQPDDLDALWQQYRKVHRALSKLETVLHRAEM